MTLIEQALSTATDTREFLVGPGVITGLDDLFKRNLPGAKALVVSDETTWRVAGERVRDNLCRAGVGCLEPLIFPAEPAPYADTDFLGRVRDALEAGGSDARAVAVGAGTINDLCKRASYELERPYICVATAASVDGYASFGAPITKDGFKKTWPCSAPRAILADSDILLTAPRSLTASGYADLAAKIPGGADWIIADALGEHPIRKDVWETTQVPLLGWLNNPAGLAAGDAKAMGDLFTGLAMTGFAMQTMHDSRPASGAEHLFSHCWEMIDVRRPDGTHPSHGDKVGIGSLCTTHMMESFFSRRFSRGDIDAAMAVYPSPEARKASIEALFAPGPMRDEIIETAMGKFISPEALRVRLEHLADVWDTLAAKVKDRLLPFAELRRRFAAAGCPTKPEEIGVAPTDVPICAKRAQTIRKRYTILDLAFETGRMDEISGELGRIWRG